MEEKLRATGRTTRIVDECMQVLLSNKRISFFMIGAIIGKHHSELVPNIKLLNDELKVIEERIFARIESEHNLTIMKTGEEILVEHKKFKPLTPEILDSVLEKTLKNFAKDKCKNCVIYKQYGPTVVCSCSL